MMNKLYSFLLLALAVPCTNAFQPMSPQEQAASPTALGNLVTAAVQSFEESRDQAVAEARFGHDTEIPAARAEAQRLWYARQREQEQQRQFKLQMSSPTPETQVQQQQQQQQQPKVDAEGLPVKAVKQISSVFGSVQGTLFGSPKPEQWID